MKKFIYSLFVLAISAMTFTGCEDVPAPYNMPQEIEEGEGETTTPLGTGSVSDPYNVAAANQVGASLSAGESTETVYIRGIVSRIDEIDPSFGNATYCISDDGTPNNQFLVYRGYSLGGEKFTSVDELKVGDEVIVKGTITNYNGTIELNQRNEIYSLNGVIAGGETGVGDGTEGNPYSASQALEMIVNGENNPDAEVYIKGKVSQIKEVSAQFGNATYWISDDGSTETQLYVFRGKYLNGEKFTSEDQLKVGDEVVILGKLTTFNDDPQVGTGSKLVSVNGQTGMIPGTEALPYTPSQALEVIANGENDPDAEVYIKGKVSQIKEVSAQFGNATYWISDDGSTDNQLYVFRGKYLNGEEFTSEDQLKVGDEVVILGKLTTYNGDPQVNTGSKIVSINGEGGGSTAGGAVSISGDVVTLTNSAVTAGTETATLNVAGITGLKRGDKPSSLTMSDGSVITFDANGETNAPAYYETDMRVYKNNIMRFSCKKTIAKIVITCSGDDRVGNKTATVSFNGNEAEYNNVFTEDKGGGVQLRITNIVVTYAK